MSTLCHSKSCQSVTLTGERFCSVHKCSSCSKEVEHGKAICSVCDLKQTRSFYSDCQAPDCGKKAFSIYVYCDSHKCREILCSDRSLDGFRYCQSHKCGVENCQNNWDCVHTCNLRCNALCPMRKCNTPRAEGSEYCDRHICRHQGCTKQTLTCALKFCIEHDPVDGWG